MTVAFTARGWEDYQSWAGERKALLRINRMIDEALRSPGDGIGKPERLRADLSGFWSRRITEEHRLVYAVEGDVITVVQCKYHYGSL